MPEQNDSPVQLCRECKKEMPAEAIKCTECGTYQNWRRHLNLSSNVLSLLIALISVIGLVLPQVAEFLHTPNSKIGVVFAALDGTSLSVALTNSGDASGYITALRLEVDDALAIPIEVAERLAKSSEYMDFSLSISDDQAQNIRRLGNCVIVVEALNSEFDKVTVRHMFEC